MLKHSWLDRLTAWWRRPPRWRLCPEAPWQAVLTAGILFAALKPVGDAADLFFDTYPSADPLAGGLRLLGSSSARLVVTLLATRVVAGVRPSACGPGEISVGNAMAERVCPSETQASPTRWGEMRTQVAV